MNSISRHNYETFFLLYADNELPVAERNMLEEFVLANPDLEKELVMLQQSILLPDHIVFDDKKSLLKTELLISSLQEKLLLYLDEEVTAAERKEIQQLINEDAWVEKEWAMLLRSKLMAEETIVFEDKASLYRKGKDKVTIFPWWRLAVAACFIGMGVWGGWVYFNNGPKIGDTAIATNVKTKVTQGTLAKVAQKTVAPVVLSTLKSGEMVVTHVITKKALPATHIQLSGKGAKRNVSDGNGIETITANEKTNNLPTPYFEDVNNIGSNKMIVAQVPPEKQLSVNNAVTKNIGNHDPASIFASTTSFTAHPEDNNNRVFFMDEEKIKKTKLGGIFKKVKRVLERNTNIKTSVNNIKVANLEFAIQ